jgi:hypothetical protein
MRNLKSKLLSFTRRFLTKVMPLDALTNLYELELRKEIRRRQMEHPNPFCRYGAFGFSQSDEDGLTIEILSRMGISKGFFCEFGVGDGTENNTLILLALGWSGSWFGGQDIILDVSKSSKLTFTKTWITKENILSLYKTIASEVDIISLDLDGNDFHFIEELLRNGANPKLFIAEYNAKFPPGVKFTMPYNPQHFWKSDDYFGASLQMFVELFSQFGYRLICCNAATGANAFFVKEEYAEKFPEVPVDIKALYSEPFYLLRGRKMHPTSVKTLQSLLQ